ncbi:PIG-L family deacetylase [Sphingobacterium sp. LRF_L2]|uniref:PIG-L family deacetylase n=1 Tax=Sphingobacterium sp. LRF_L2 TaxID=3369421 RepID=UPI003F63AFB5
MRRYFICIAVAAVFIKYSSAQYQPLNASEIYQNIERLNVLGSVLYFAAHPDDENTKLIAYLASERKVRTAYLSLTRGDGGQNLIGTEQGIELGLIRTQELLQARKIDGGEQYFSSAFDFGFSKTFEETFSFWKKQEVLREAVWIIRKLQPDVIITRFPPDERGGHGHHQASAILAREAFNAAADPKAFPEQLKEVKPWKTARLLWNTANFMQMQGDSKNQLKIDIGAFNPVLGLSYGEISAKSRSQHKSQGFGTAATNGKTIETFEFVAGSKPSTDLFDGLDISWERVPKSQSVHNEIKKLISNFNFSKPETAVPQLAKIWNELNNLDNGYWKTQKIKEVENLILACSGIKIESISLQPRFTENSNIPFQTEIIKRNNDLSVQLLTINEQRINKTLPTNEIERFEGTIPNVNSTQPYWLQKPSSLGKFDVEEKYYGFPTNPDMPSAKVVLDFQGIPINISVPIQYRYVDPVRGEIHEYIEVVPSITASVETKSVLLETGQKRTLSITFERNDTNLNTANIDVNISSPGWTVSEEKIPLTFEKNQTNITKTIQISNLPGNTEDASLRFIYNGKALKDIREISYEHIPRQAWFPDVNVKLEPLTLINPVKKVGYIMGAGDLVPESLRNIGIGVDILDITKLNRDILSSYDAIIFGVRVLNVEPGIAKKLPIVFDYVKDGGTLLMQYNVNSRLITENIAPYPFQITRSRVTEEDAIVEFIDPSDPVLNYPNKITSNDFKGWIQERGLYFAEHIDSSYRTPLLMHDKNEPAHNGSLLVNKLGKGKFVYTSLSFFRQLPAGIPGAYRLFVNLLAKEQ